MESFTLYLDESKFVKMNGDIKEYIYAVAGVAISSLNEHEVRADLDKIKITICKPKHRSEVNRAKQLIFHEAEIRSNNVAILSKNPSYSVFVGSSQNPRLAIEGVGSIINKFSLNIFGSIIDQSSLAKKYNKHIENNSYESYNIALKIIVENYAMFLKSVGATGRIVFESRQDDTNKIQDERTQKMIYKILAHGTTIYSAIELQRTIIGLSFRKKTENVPGLQIADFIPRPLLLSYAQYPQSKPSIYQSAIKENRFNNNEDKGYQYYGVRAIN